MSFFKNRNFLHTLFFSGLVTVSLTLLWACANMARPGGGPIDEQPPVFVHSKPTPEQLHFKGKKIEIVFNENIKIDKPSEKVIVSPPQISMPIIKSNSKTVTIELGDTLLPNTTYTIDFGDAIQDNNEGNPLKDFSFSFSTGDVIDSLQISGTVLEAANLEPVTGMIVGIQSDLTDSAFYKKPFDRIGKTNELGKFYIRNITPGTYRVYALKDVNNNYIFDMSSENIAFLDSIIVPSMDMKLHRDTIWKDSLTIDTIRVHDVQHFFPDDLVLRSFNENKNSVYFEKGERLQPNKVTFYFSAPEDSLPLIKGLNFDETDWAYIESSLKHDTVSYWIKDTLVSKLDTLLLSNTYLYTDTLNNLVPKTDTLELFVKGVKKAPTKQKNKDSKKKKDQDSVQIAYLTYKEMIPSNLEIGMKPHLVFDEPILPFDNEHIRLELKKDSLYILQPSLLEQVPNKLREYTLKANLMPGEEYVLTLDSAAFTGIYGLNNPLKSYTFKVKNVEEYSNLVFSLSNLKGPAFMELLDGKDTPVAKAIVKNDEAKFMHIKPGTYYARIVLDTNENGVFDTGDYAVKRQPEEVHYFKDALNLRANWDVRQEWNLYDKPLTQEKPLEITKNKPKEEQKKNDKDRNQSSTNSSANLTQPFSTRR